MLTKGKALMHAIEQGSPEPTNAAQAAELAGLEVGCAWCRAPLGKGFDPDKLRHLCHKCRANHRAENLRAFEEHRRSGAEVRKWSEYDSVAKWCAQRGFKGDRTDQLPDAISEPVMAEINNNNEAFQERVRATAYGLAMEGRAVVHDDGESGATALEELRRKIESWPDLLAACKAALDTLHAWTAHVGNHFTHAPGTHATKDQLRCAINRAESGAS